MNWSAQGYKEDSSAHSSPGYHFWMGGIISTNLVPHVHGHIAMLYHVSRSPELYTENEAIPKAIQKYINLNKLVLFLLQLRSTAYIWWRYRHFMVLRAHGLAKSTTLEVEWIWHVVCNSNKMCIMFLISLAFPTYFSIAWILSCMQMTVWKPLAK